jgi:hypothetical protein
LIINTQTKTGNCISGPKGGESLSEEEKERRRSERLAAAEKRIVDEGTRGTKTFRPRESLSTASSSGASRSDAEDVRQAAIAAQWAKGS